MNTNKVVKIESNNTNTTTFGGSFKATLGQYAATMVVNTLGLLAFGSAVFLIIRAFK